VLAWSQECTTREEALSADRQIKNWSRKKKEAMMRDALIEISAEVSRLAQSKSSHPSTGSTAGVVYGQTNGFTFTRLFCAKSNGL